MGEELELRWTFFNKNATISAPKSFARRFFDEISFDSKNTDDENQENINDINTSETLTTIPLRYGFFVENCMAERLDGVAPAPPPLSLIVNG